MIIANALPTTNTPSKTQMMSIFPPWVVKYNPAEGMTINKKAVRWDSNLCSRIQDNILYPCPHYLDPSPALPDVGEGAFVPPFTGG